MNKPLDEFSKLKVDSETYQLRLGGDEILPLKEACIYGTIESVIGDEIIMTSHYPLLIYTHQIVLHPDHMLISCDCGSKDMPCEHTKGLLTHLIHEYGSGYFKQFREFPFDNVERYRQFFDIKYRKTMVTVNAKEEFGHIYNRAGNITVPKPPYWTEPHSPDVQPNSMIGYAMGILDRDFDMPFLIPYHGLLNKAKTEIKSFTKYLELPEPYGDYSPEQRLLNSYCQDFEQLRLSEAIPEEERNEQAYIALKERNRALGFAYWKELLPLLIKQPHLKQINFYRKVDYQKQPVKQGMYVISYSQEKLQFKLILEEKDSYYVLRCQPYIGDKAYDLYRVYPTRAPFFFTLKRDPTVQYLFSNLQEAAVINYLKESGFALYILAEDIEEFKSTILKEWAELFVIEGG